VKAAAFESAVEARDFEALTATLAPDVIFRSPVVFRPYEGKEVVSLILGAAVRVFRDFEYVERLESGNLAALVFRARVGDRQVDGIDLLRFDSEGRVGQLTVMVRPMSGVQALADGMGRELERLGVAPPAS
jgi:hypothetical protein